MKVTVNQLFLSEEAMLAFAAALAKCLQPGTIIFLHGELGAGKTTFTRGLLRGLGYQGKVKSPTYTIVEPYALADSAVTLFHFDLYRLHAAEELLDLGVQDYFSAQTMNVIEWPEKGSTYLPKPDLDCYIDFANPGRDLQIAACTQRGEEILQGLMSG